MGIEKKIWIYWSFCAAATAIVAANWGKVTKLLSDKAAGPPNRSGYSIWLFFAWGATLSVAFAYVVFTRKLQSGRYQPSDFLVFALMNGVLEQFMFILWFLAGCWIARRFTRRPALVFVAGYAAYALYSGPIHAMFWVKVLPAHIPATWIMGVLLSTMSCLWMWLLWRYRAVGSIVAMHIAADFLMVAHLHSRWFEQLALERLVR